MDRSSDSGSSRITADQTRAELRAEVVNRLRPVCINWSAADFEKLVDDVTDATLKYPHRPKSD